MSQSTAHDHIGEEPCFTTIIDGLTKRELFAAMAMQGFCAHPLILNDSAVNIAVYAVRHADALIAELSR